MPSHLPPLNDAEARDCELVFRLTEKQMGFVPNSMRIMARQPAILGNFTMLVGTLLGEQPKNVFALLSCVRLLVKNAIWTFRHLRSNDRLPAGLKNLVGHVASQASGCRYCQAHTVQAASKQGVEIGKLEAVWEFETSELFDDSEKSALRFAIAGGSSPNAVTSQHFTELRLHFNDQQIVELTAVVALFGFLNRWNDTLATSLEAEAAAFAQDHLVSSGWVIGKHAS